MKELNLSTDWQVCSLSMDSLYPPLTAEAHWLDCNLPTDVREPLIAKGHLKDPVLADYCYESQWIEQKAFWFKKSFSLPIGAPEEKEYRLTLQAIDGIGDIWLNHHFIGRHQNAHRPFSKTITSLLQEKNEIVIRITTGLEQVSDAMLADINWAVCHEKDNGMPDRGDLRRAFIRRPQYSSGWDWTPRIVTCGLMGAVVLESVAPMEIKSAWLKTTSLSPEATLEGEVTVELTNPISTRSASLVAQLFFQENCVAEFRLPPRLLTSGLNYLPLEFKLSNPKLWWPNGYGEQPLYRVKITLQSENLEATYPDFFVGIRHLSLNLDYISPNEHQFCFMVNGQAIFCKGANWIPADALYSRVSQEKYHYLLTQAKEANFTMLRVWGGGLYEQDIFYNLCDKLGILVWQDFMFACACYPDHLPEFQRECALEMDYQTKRLRHHASLALFCGNNENHWIFNPQDNPQWQIDPSAEKAYGLDLSNYLAKEILHRNCPHIPYWNSSPYGGILPNDSQIGDVHFWKEAMMHPEVDKRIDFHAFDQLKAKFVSEYGYPGPCSLASTQTYMDGKTGKTAEKISALHTNTFEKQTVLAGIKKHYLPGAQNLRPEDYVLYAQGVQCLMLEHSLETFRSQANCNGALFWMYNDCWGEVGWSIIDYYGRRKSSYYGVARAFSPVKFILRTTASKEYCLWGCNDTAETIRISGEVGFIGYDNSRKDTKPLEVELLPHSRAPLVLCPLPEENYSEGTIFFIPDKDLYDFAALSKVEPYQRLYQSQPPEILEQYQQEANVLLTLFCPTYCHSVYVEGDFLCSDNYFDLYPGQKKQILVYNAAITDLKINYIPSGE